MKLFIIALTFLISLTVNNFAQAVPFTRTQMDTIFVDVEQIKSDNTFDFNVDSFKEAFNARITPILQNITGTDDISAMEHLFFIYDYKVFEKPDGDLFANIFPDSRIALVGMLEPNGGNFKNLNLYYTTPEEKDESLFTVWLLTAFIQTLTPDVIPQALMTELTAENSLGESVKDGVKYKISSQGNLNVLTATIAQ
ncbi:MAG: hypothetical protein K6G55_05675 [Selenomonadaceae bacterium]|nr:hypothetical protein [Selenomonadaceae bacterium]